MLLNVFDKYSLASVSFICKETASVQDKLKILYKVTITTENFAATEYIPFAHRD